MTGIFPSLISGDILNIQKEIELLEPYCEGFHLDIMDNHFVPNLTWGAQFINRIAYTTKKTSWVHLMVDNPDEWIERLVLPNKSIISFHFESSKDSMRTIQFIKKKKWRPSIAIKPKTPAHNIFHFFELGIDHVLIMSVEPGFSGQIYLTGVDEKIDELSKHRMKRRLNITLGIDGGINKNNIVALAEKGIDHFAIATGIFAEEDHVGTLKKLQELIAYKSL